MPVRDIGTTVGRQKVIDDQEVNRGGGLSGGHSFVARFGDRDFMASRVERNANYLNDQGSSSTIRIFANASRHTIRAQGVGVFLWSGGA